MKARRDAAAVARGLARLRQAAAKDPEGQTGLVAAADIACYERRYAEATAEHRITPPVPHHLMPKVNPDGSAILYSTYLGGGLPVGATVIRHPANQVEDGVRVKAN